MSRSAATLATVAILGLACLCPAPGRGATPPSVAPAVAHDEGVWDLDFERGNRRCRLFLRSDAHAGGYALSMPPGCHHAFPQLARATNWTAGDQEHVLFRTDAGATVVDFGPNGTAALSGVVSENDVYTLMPVNAATQDAIKRVQIGPVPPVAAAAPAGQAAAQGVVVDRSANRAKGTTRPESGTATLALPPVTAAEVAGNYAVVRKDRDTGCMVTLEPDERGAKGSAHAKLAPGCGDQGIVIFDPARWQLTRGELVLTAKRGHTTVLTRRDQKTWANAPSSGAALVLKRL